MQVVKFLNSILTPQVATCSLQCSISNKDSLKNIESKFGSNNRISKNKTQQNIAICKFNSLQDRYLKIQTPFYIDKRTKPNYGQGYSYHQKKTDPQQMRSNFSCYLKKSQGYNNNEETRKKIAIQKRAFVRNYERYTYQPPRPVAADESIHLMRKQFAETQKQHKFCTNFGICCNICKCKLDCINLKFEQFLRKADLYILKGIKKIVGRGVNLNGQMKAQILNIFQENKKNLTSQTIMNLIKKAILQKMGKNCQKKYLCWAKNMIKVIKYVQLKTNQKNKNNKFLNKIIDFSQVQIQKQNNLQELNQNISNISQNNKKNMSKYFQAKNDEKSKLTKKVKKYKQNIDINNKNALKISGNQAQLHQLKIMNQQSIGSKSIRPFSIIKSKQSFQSIDQTSQKLDIQEKNMQQKFIEKHRKYANSVQNTKRMYRNLLNKQQKKQGYSYELNFCPKYENLQIQKEEKKIRASSQSKISIESISFDSSSQELVDKLRESAVQPIKKSKKIIGSIKKLNQSRRKIPQNFNNNQQNIIQEKTQKTQKYQQKQQNQQKQFFSINRSAHTILNRLKVRDSKIKKFAQLSLISTNQNLFPQIFNQLNTSQNKQKLIKSKRKIVKKKTNGRPKFYPQLDKIKKDLQLSQIKFNQAQQENKRIKSIKNQVKQYNTLIQRVQQKLREAGLQSCILKLIDCLLTRKRKIRKIKKQVQNGILTDQNLDIQRYLLVYDKKAQNIELSNNFINEKTTTKDFIDHGKNQTDQLKFYELAPSFVVEPIKIGIKARSLSSKDPILVQPKIRLKIQQPPKNKHLLDQFECSVSLKNKLPFDYYHYLYLGNSLAQKINSNQRQGNQHKNIRNIAQKQFGKKQNIFCV